MILKEIAKRGYMRVLVEGGAELTASLLKENFINEIYWFRASNIMGGNGLEAIPSVGVANLDQLKKFKLTNSKCIDNDELSIYKKY